MSLRCTPHLNYITKEHKVKKGLLTRLWIIYNSSPLSYTLDTIFLFHNEETNINDFSSHLGIPSIMGDLHKRGSFFHIRVLTYQILIFVRLQWTYGTDKIAQWAIIHWRKYGWFLYFFTLYFIQLLHNLIMLELIGYPFALKNKKSQLHYQIRYNSIIDLECWISNSMLEKR